MSKTISTKNRGDWNKGKRVGQNAPLKPPQVWGIPVRVQPANCRRGLALFNLAIDS